MRAACRARWRGPYPCRRTVDRPTNRPQRAGRRARRSPTARSGLDGSRDRARVRQTSGAPPGSGSRSPARRSFSIAGETLRLAVTFASRDFDMSGSAVVQFPAAAIGTPTWRSRELTAGRDRPAALRAGRRPRHRAGGHRRHGRRATRHHRRHRHTTRALQNGSSARSSLFDHHQVGQVPRVDSRIDPRRALIVRRAGRRSANRLRFRCSRTRGNSRPTPAMPV
jgi:hypothetical protein